MRRARSRPSGTSALGTNPFARWYFSRPTAKAVWNVSDPNAWRHQECKEGFCLSTFGGASPWAINLFCAVWLAKGWQHKDYTLSLRVPLQDLEAHQTAADDS